MGILVECPLCHRKQSTKNKHCAECGDHLDKQKRNGKARYWVVTRLPGGKQRKEFAGYSVQEARDAEGKRKGQKREGRILEMLPQAKVTFGKLTEWYMEKFMIQAELAEAARAKGKTRKGPSRGYIKKLWTSFNVFNKVFGNTSACDISDEELQAYCARRERSVTPYTIDVDMSIIRSMVNAAFDADKVDGRVLKVFRRIKAIASADEKTRKRAVTVVEYLKLLAVAPLHLRAMLQLAMFTGMRHGEIRKLQWRHIDRKATAIRLTPDITKNKRPRTIPITKPIKEVIDSLPRHLHGYVITYNGSPLSAVLGRNRAWEHTCRRAGVPCGKKTIDGIVFHDLRRSAKTNMVRAGVNKVYRDLILGHSLQGMDAHYIVESGLEDELRQAMAQYSAWLVAQLSANVAQNVAQQEVNDLNK
jgi:integrase